MEDNVIFILQEYGLVSLEQIPNYLLETLEQGIANQFPAAFCYLESYYNKMKKHIQEEFDNGTTAAKTSQA